MKNILIRAALALLVITLTSQRSFAQTAEELFQKGVQLEEVKGELEKAIESFKTVVEKFPANKPLAAKALLHLGKCYEKLGNTEARMAYERIVKEFADQREVATEARARLKTLLAEANGKNNSGIAVRRLWEAPRRHDYLAAILGSVSPDGRYLSYTDWDGSELAIRDLTTGARRHLTNKGSYKAYPTESVFSPDGRLVAYAWLDGNDPASLEIVGLDGSEPRVLYKNDEVSYIQPSAWTADGKKIVAVLSRKDRTNQIALISAGDGSLRILKSFDWRYPRIIQSPDSRYITYDFPPLENSGDRDIFLLAIDGSREVPLVQHPSNDQALGWSSDAKWLLFSSDRSGTKSAWIIRVEGEKIVGAPELVKTDIGQLSPLAVTKNGSFYYNQRTGDRDVYVATVDLNEGKVLSPPTPVNPRLLGANELPDWSPDGRYICYLTKRAPGGGIGGSGTFGAISIAIQSVEAGEVRTITPQLIRVNHLRWAPDGRSIFVWGFEQKRGGLYKIDVETGNVTLQKSSPGRTFSVWPDGKKIYYREGLNRTGILNLETGDEEKRLERITGYVDAWDLTRDGQKLVFPAGDTTKKYTYVKVVSLGDGKSYEVTRMEPSEWLWSTAWSYDGKHVIFVTSDSNSVSREIWVVPAAGGEPKNLGIKMDVIRPVRVHPDGKHIAFTAGVDRNEVWVMENFLPNEKSRKK